MKNKTCYIVLFLIVGGAAFVYYDPLSLFAEDELRTGLVMEDRLRVDFIGTDSDFLDAGISIHVVQGDVDIYFVLNDMHDSDMSDEEFDYNVNMIVTVTWLFDDSELESEFSISFAGHYNIGRTVKAVKITIVPI